MGRTRDRVRWAVPVLTAAVVATAVAVPAVAGSAPPALPPVSAAELVADAAVARVDGLSGTVTSTARLGLPALPSNGTGGSALTLPGLLAGTTTARVWQAGEDRSRVAVDAPFAELVVVRDGRELWTFDSASRDVTRVVLPGRAAADRDVVDRDAAVDDEPVVTPQRAAQALLELVDPSTAVRVDGTARVAGRAAYELVLEPRDPVSLVASVRVAVDAETSVPLRVRVLAEGQPEPALEVGFTEVSFDVPDPSLFAFTPPPGSQVTERRLPSAAQLRGLAAVLPRPSGQGRLSAPGLPVEVVGDGWSAVLVAGPLPLPEQARGLLRSVGTPVEGGVLVRSALLSVLVLDDGRVLTGAVPGERLQELAAG